MSLLLPILLPLLLAAAPAFGRRGRAILPALAPWAPLTLLWPLLQPAQLNMSWPLVGLQLAVDGISRPIILLTAVAWTLAGLFARDTVTVRRTGFWSGWLGSLAGMSLLLLAADLAGFYAGYALLSLAAYLLITHVGSAPAWRAGRVYLVMALAGEAGVLAGLLILAGHLGNVELATLAEAVVVLHETPARWLLLAGFAVKLGIVPLHMWLALAHPVAPVPASAILSGVIVKAGLMGWLRLAPATGLEPQAAGLIMLALGLITAFTGVGLGLAQTRIKTVLAYSTISQMGLVLCAFSLLWLAPDHLALILPVIGLFALHHGLNKASLFLACGCAPGTDRLRRVLVAISTLSLAAAPLTTGFIAKAELKDALATALPGATWTVLLALTSAATAALMWKVWRLSGEMQDRAVRLHPAWLLLVAAALTLPWLWAGHQGIAFDISLGRLWAAGWPLLIAAGLLLGFRWLVPNRMPTVPEGDLVVWAERAARALAPLVRFRPASRPSRAGIRLRRLRAVITGAEAGLRRLPATGLVLLAAGGGLWLLLWRGG